MNTLLYSTLLGAMVIAASCVVLRASWYDFRAISRRARLDHVVRILRRAKQPRVAVLIDVNDSDAMIERSVQAVFTSRYYHMTVCVVSQPTPAIKQLIQKYQQLHPQSVLHRYAPLRHVSQKQRLQQAYRRHSKHDFILILQAGDIVTPGTIKHAVARFYDDQRLGSLQLARRHPLSYSLTSLLVRYRQASNQLLQKAWLRLPRRSSSPQTSTMYRHSYFMEHAHQPARRRHYDATLSLTSEYSSFSQLTRVTYAMWPIRLTVTYTFIWLFVTTTTLQNSSSLLLAWISVGLWTIVAIWSETGPDRSEKLTLSYGTLVSPLLLVIHSAWLTIALPFEAFAWCMRQWHRTRHNPNRHRYQRDVLNNILAFKARYEEMCPRDLWYQDQRRADD